MSARTTARHFENLLADGDFAALAELARDAARRGDSDARTRMVDPLWDWLESRWREQPLPRLAELLERLGPLRQTDAGRALAERARTEKRIDDAAWSAVLRADTRARDLDALLAAAPRGQTREVMDRVGDLADRFGAEHRDPRLSATFGHWLEAPPLRATSTQPMWTRVFAILDAVGDPRTLAALRLLADKPFPAGGAMAAAMATRMRNALERFEARNADGRLDRLLAPAAEGALAPRLDAASLLVVALAGGDFVASGGEAQGRALGSFLVVPEAAAVPRRAIAARPRRTTLPCPWERDLRVLGASDDGATLLIADLHTLYVVTRDGLQLHGEPGAGVAGVRLSPDGRRLAIHRGDRLTLVELERGTRQELALLDAEDDAPLEVPQYGSPRLSTAPLIAFGDDAVFVLVLVSACAFGTLYQGEARILRAPTAHTDPGALLDEVERFATVSVAYPEQVHATTRTEVRQMFEGALDLAPGGARLAMAAPLGPGGQRHLYVFDCATRRVVQASALASTMGRQRQPVQTEVRWLDAQHLVLRLGDEPARRVEADTLWTTPGAVKWPGEPSRPQDLSLAQVDRVAVARGSDRVAFVAEAGAVQIYELGAGGGARVAELAGKGEVGGLALSPDGALLYLARTSMIVARKVGGRGDVLKIKSHKDAVRWLWLSADGARLVSAAFDAVRVWQLPAATCLLDVRAHATLDARGELHPSGEVLLSWDAARVVLTSLAGAAELARLEPDERISACAFTPDGQRVMLGLGHRVELWSPEDGARTLLSTREGEVTALASEPGGRWAVADASGRVAVGGVLEPDAAPVEVLARALRPPRELVFAPGDRLVVPSGHHGGPGAVTVVSLGESEEEH